MMKIYDSKNTVKMLMKTNIFFGKSRQARSGQFHLFDKQIVHVLAH